MYGSRCHSRGKVLIAFGYADILLFLCLMCCCCLWQTLTQRRRTHPSLCVYFFSFGVPRKLFSWLTAVPSPHTSHVFGRSLRPPACDFCHAMPGHAIPEG